MIPNLELFSIIFALGASVVTIVGTLIGCTVKICSVINNKVDHNTCATRQAKCPCVKWMDEHKAQHIRDDD